MNNKLLKEALELEIAPTYTKNLFTSPKFPTNKQNIVDWLITSNNNKTNYDYSLELYDLLIDWVSENNYHIDIPEDEFLPKFMSMLYFTSK